MKISYEVNQLTVGDVSWVLFRKVVQAIGQYEAENEKEQEAEHWGTLQKESEILSELLPL
jgi:hypothetical protein